MMNIKFSEFEDNDRGRQLAEMTKADYWEAQADMWHQNYKEAINETERLREQAHYHYENGLKKDVEIESLRDALRWAAPYVKDDPRVEDDFEYFPQPMRWEQYVSGGGTITAVSAIIKAALKEGE
jgi:hypothetical protein